MESLHSFQWGDSEIHKISNFKSHLSTLGVGITLLTRLSRLETLTNQLDLLFGLFQNIGSENLPFSGQRPVQGCATLPPIQSFKWCHLQTRLVAVVVGEFCIEQTVLPLGTVGSSTCAEHIL